MIKILFVRRHKFNIISWLIMKSEKANYSHVAAMIYTELGPIIFESSTFGVQPTSYSKFIEHYEVVESITLKADFAQKKTIFMTAMKLVGTKFSVLGLIGAALARVFHMSKNIFADGDRTEFCSEFVYDILNEALTLSGFSPEIDGPKKLMEILRREKESKGGQGHKSYEGIQIW